MNVPLLIILLSVLISVITTVNRTRPRASAWIGAGGLLLLGLFIWLAPLEEAFNIAGIALKFTNQFNILGRALVLDDTTRGFVGFIYAASAFLLVAGSNANTNRLFTPLAVFMCIILASALMMKPFVYSAILIEIAAMVAVVMLVAPEYPARRTAMRLIFVFTLAMMAILTAGWMLDVVGVTGATPGTARWTTGLLAIGMAVMLAIPPFHYWLSAAADESNPFVVAAFLLLSQTIGLFFLLRFLDTYEWLRTQPEIFSAIRTAGMGMVWFSGIMSLGQRRMARIIMYGMIADLGILLMAVGLGSEGGFALALQMTAARVPGIVLWVASLTYLIRVVGDDLVDRLEGAAHRHIFGAIFMLIGMSASFGFPFSATFPSRWAMLEPMAGVDRFGILTIMFAWVFGGAILLRWFVLLWRSEKRDRPEGFVIGQWAFMIGCAALILLLGMFPQIVLPWVRQVGDGLQQILP